MSGTELVDCDDAEHAAPGLSGELRARCARLEATSWPLAELSEVELVPEAQPTTR